MVVLWWLHGGIVVASWRRWYMHLSPKYLQFVRQTLSVQSFLGNVFDVS